ncbi:hypothetical protein B0H11DRAFT_1911896 [Mycena galericulata]|nr:hypothetical protein B0H11DRAFT_1911896 [Mycena galericulata]
MLTTGRYALLYTTALVAGQHRALPETNEDIERVRDETAVKLQELQLRSPPSPAPMNSVVLPAENAVVTVPAPRFTAPPVVDEIRCNLGTVPVAADVLAANEPVGSSSSNIRSSSADCSASMLKILPSEAWVVKKKRQFTYWFSKAVSMVSKMGPVWATSTSSRSIGAKDQGDQHGQKCRSCEQSVSKDTDIKLKHTTLGKIPTVSVTGDSTGSALKSLNDANGAAEVEYGPYLRLLGLVTSKEVEAPVELLADWFGCKVRWIDERRCSWTAAATEVMVDWR